LGISCSHGDPTLDALRYRAVSTSSESVANAISADAGSVLVSRNIIVFFAFRIMFRPKHAAGAVCRGASVSAITLSLDFCSASGSDLGIALT